MKEQSLEKATICWPALHKALRVEMKLFSYFMFVNVEQRQIGVEEQLFS